MKSLIIGRGFGSLYEGQLAFSNSEIITVDSDPNRTATFQSLDDVPTNIRFDTAHVCTPNYLHGQHAWRAATQSDIVFVEKPGVETADVWEHFIRAFPDTRFFMVKNNMFRDQVTLLQGLAKKARTVNLYWINRDRVPNPGSWFTTKELAYGGVSRDLVPHLLSWIPALFPTTWRDAHPISKKIQQRWELSDLVGTDYGTVKKDGVYDVDDYAQIQFVMSGVLINVEANWKAMNGPLDTITKDKRCVEFVFDDGTTLSYDFGLCPEYAYRNMIQTCVNNKRHSDFWAEHNAIDLWIHRHLEKFNE